jgi:hypothetical protein
MSERRPLPSPPAPAGTRLGAVTLLSRVVSSLAGKQLHILIAKLAMGSIGIDDYRVHFLPRWPHLAGFRSHAALNFSDMPAVELPDKGPLVTLGQ